MCLLSSVALRFALELNEALWFASLVLNVVAVSPTYVSVFVPLVTVAWYTMFWVKHSPFSGHVLVFGQLHFRSLLEELQAFSFLLFSSSIITATLGIQLYDSFTMFLLKILWSLLDGVKHCFIMLRNFFPIFVLTFWLYGGLYQMSFRFLLRLLAVACGGV